MCPSLKPPTSEDPRHDDSLIVARITRIRPLLGLLFVAETGAWLVLLSRLVFRGVGWLCRPTVQKTTERLTGAVLIGHRGTCHPVAGIVYWPLTL
jgi:hypothetical protein